MSVENESQTNTTEEKDNDEPELSLSTLAALNEFLSEKKEREEQLNRIAESIREKSADDQIIDVDLEEDWVRMCIINFIFTFK